MKKSVLEIYSLAVCFVVIICFAITLGKGTYDIIRIINPSFTLVSYQYTQFQTNDDFCNAFDKTKKCIGKNDDQITKMREAGYSIALQNERRDGVQGLVVALIVLLVNAIIFIPHWLIARKARA
ncbi:MAG: hypothetical protein ABI597_12400 [Gammaproteobacteria bacterium]